MEKWQIFNKKISIQKNFWTKNDAENLKFFFENIFRKINKIVISNLPEPSECSLKSIRVHFSDQIEPICPNLLAIFQIKNCIKYKKGRP